MSMLANTEATDNVQEKQLKHKPREFKSTNQDEQSFLCRSQQNILLKSHEFVADLQKHRRFGSKGSFSAEAPGQIGDKSSRKYDCDSPKLGIMFFGKSSGSACVIIKGRLPFRIPGILLGMFGISVDLERGITATVVFEQLVCLLICLQSFGSVRD